MNIDLDKNKRERLRWYILVAVHRGMPHGTNEPVIKSIAEEIDPQITDRLLRRDIDYLDELDLMHVDKPYDAGYWSCKLTAKGTQFVEYNAAPIPGIARPVRS